MELSYTNQQANIGVNSGRKLPQVVIYEEFSVIPSNFHDRFMTIMKKNNA